MWVFMCCSDCHRAPGHIPGVHTPPLLEAAQHGLVRPISTPPHPEVVLFLSVAQQWMRHCPP